MIAETSLTGEMGVIAGIVRQSLCDLKSRDPAIKADAERFFRDGRLEVLLGFTNTDPDAVRRLMDLAP